MNNVSKITITKPNDFHVHFRQGDMLKLVVPETDKVYKNCIVMPNTIPPITNGKLAKNYYDEIKKYTINNLNPLMTFYLNEKTDLNDMIRSFNNKTIFALKLYPQGATTNSQKGVKNIKKIYPILSTMEKFDIPLLIHGEDTDLDVDIFDKEKSFIDKYLHDIINEFPKLRITLEHITTLDAINFINSSNNVYASITPHHLAANRNDMFLNGINPHLYCLPILKRRKHQEALVKVATSGNKKFFLGTDSAPHQKKEKESSCGCAGVFNTINSIETITQIFENENALENLENFVSFNGSRHYNLPLNKDKITLVKDVKPIVFPKYLKKNNLNVIVFKPKFPIFWKLLTGY